MGIGKIGEEIAQNYLIQKGYKIITTNYRSRFGEIDIIAFKDGCTVFVEVKFRSSLVFGRPLEAITRSKLRKLIKTAQFYLFGQKKVNSEYRFDAIEIFGSTTDYKIDHVENITQ